MSAFRAIQGPAAGSEPGVRTLPRLRRGLAAAAACAAAVLTGCFSSGGTGGGILQSTAGPSAGGTGRVVAEIQLDAPDRKTFIVRATVPVPPDTFPRADGLIPLTVLDWDGTETPTQVEAVTWYPDRTKGADVVEVLARVHRDHGIAPGTPITYQVVDSWQSPTKMLVDDNVLSLMSDPGSVLVVARDAFGNTYGADIARDLRLDYGAHQLRMLRDGPVAIQMATYHVLQPSGATPAGPPAGPLSHLFGVHAYFTSWRGEDVMSLDLRVHNGHSGLNGGTPLDNPLGKVYFESLELWLPQGWTASADVEDPAFGTATPITQQTWNVIPIVRARGDGKMHVMPSQGQFHRRLVVHPDGADFKARHFLETQELGFCRPGYVAGNELWSWWNSQTARYFPQSHRLPSLDHLGMSSVRSQLNGQFNQVRNVLASGQAGSYPVDHGMLGWAHPWGSRYGGMTGGSEIYLFDGIRTAYAASNRGYRLAQMTHRMYTSRHPVVLFNADGSATRASQWVVHGSSGDYLPFSFNLTLLGGNDPFGMSSTPVYHRNYVQANGLAPGYESNLLSFHPIDLQHHIRYTRSPKTLIWLGNDAIAKDDIRMAAELGRMSYQPLPNSNSGYADGWGLYRDITFTTNNPGRGFSFGRAEGWLTDAMCAAYAIGDDAWRGEALPWFQDVADTVSRGQASCSGFIQSIVNSKMFGGNYRARQSIEQAITENALRSMVETVFRGVDGARTVQTETALEDSAYGMVGPMAWHNGWHGPASYLAVAPLDFGQAPYCGSTPGQANGPDTYQIWATFAYAYELTGDSVFLNRAAEVLGGGDLLTQLEAGGYNALENRAALLALAQQY